MISAPLVKFPVPFWHRNLQALIQIQASNPSIWNLCSFDAINGDNRSTIQSGRWWQQTHLKIKTINDSNTFCQ